MSETPGNGLRVTGPGGLGLAATGRDVVLIVVILVGFLALGWIMRDMNAMMAREQLERRVEHAQQLTINRELVCLFAIDPSLRTDAVRSGNVCNWLNLAPRKEVR